MPQSISISSFSSTWMWSNSKEFRAVELVFTILGSIKFVAPDLWLPISFDSYLCCEDVIMSKLVYAVLARPKIRPTHVSAVT